MMQRVTTKQIEMRIVRLVREGMDLGLDGQYGQFRVTNKEGGTNLSPRVPNRQVMDWLDAFEAGYNAGYGQGHKDGSTHRAAPSD